MQKNMILFLCAMLFTVGLSGCKPSKQNGVKDQHNATHSSETLPQTYTDEKDGFRFQYPEDWSLQTGFMGARVFVSAPPVDDFAANMNVALTPKDPTLWDHKEDDFKSMYQIFLRDVEILEFKKDKFAGQDAIYVHYRGEMGKGNLLEFQQYMLIVGDQNFVITLTDKKDHFSKHQETFNAILASFKF